MIWVALIFISVFWEFVFLGTMAIASNLMLLNKVEKGDSSYQWDLVLNGHIMLNQRGP